MSKRLVLQAARHGEWAELAGRRISAEAVRLVCLDESHLDPRGVRIRGAEVTGMLDLSGVSMAVPLRFDGCTFTDELRVEGASLHELALTDCRLSGGVRANGVHVAHDLDLSGSHVSGAIATAVSANRAAIWLCEAEIGGRLLCHGTRVDGDADRSLFADLLLVRGSIQLLDFVARAEVRLYNAKIHGSIDCTGARVSPGQLAINLANAAVGGSVVLAEMHVNGWIAMSSVRIGAHFVVRDTELHDDGSGVVRRTDKYATGRTPDTVLWAQRLSVNGTVSFESACRTRGRLDFSLGDFGGVRFDSGCVLEAPDDVALDLTNAELRSGLIMHKGVDVAGTVRIEGAAINGNLTLQRISMRRPAGLALLAASSVRVAGDVELEGIHTDGGTLNFRAADLGNNLDASGAVLRNQEGLTLRLLGTRVRGSVRLTSGFSSAGGVELRRSVIEGRLDLRGGEFVRVVPGGPQRLAIDAEWANVQGGMYLGWRRVTSSVSFQASRTTVLADDPDRWPERFVISGMTYERFGSLGPDHDHVWDGRARARWLARQASFDSGAYEQAATVFRQHGRRADAEHLLIMQRKHALREQNSLGRPLGRWLRVAVNRLYGMFGFGYRPGRAGWPLVLLLALVFLIALLPFGANTMRTTDDRGNVYAPTGRVVTIDPADKAADLGPDYVVPAATPARPDACGDGQVRCYNPFFYAVDTVVPLISLNQRSTWYPDSHAAGGWLIELTLDLATLLGWGLSSILVLSAAQLARNV
ncbi:hypothetical protein [Labedaea rhizosphaerae]|uniref:Membrane-associated oxidoreductase n=1 Tax=Labedaea rhizosphaerae TaxID=598644 RepID=A0A4R6S000_LABRH|nr:hypothetical protein [Labedaea rhizosphaerae]TDP92819.1 hypothetical protein EV186_10734 [Labedaea rhizosphaerae]